MANMKNWLKLMESVDQPAPQVEEQQTQEAAECNQTAEGEDCPVHGLKECGMMEELAFENWNVIYDSVHAKNVKANVRVKKNMEEAEVREWFQRVFSPMSVHEVARIAVEDKIDELSPATLGSYADKAEKERDAKWADSGKDADAAKKYYNRKQGVQKAASKLDLANEEQVDEFSLNNLGSGSTSANVQVKPNAGATISVNGKNIVAKDKPTADKLAAQIKKGEIAVEANADSQWGKPEELLRNVAQTLEREVEWPLTELLPRDEVGRAMQPIQDLVQSAIGNLPDNESLEEGDRDPAGQYSDLSDVYEPGPTEIWYWKQDAGRDMMMGKNFLLKHGRMPDPSNLEATHVKIGSVKETNPEKIFHMMQGEIWSPEGQARNMIRSSDTGHTSMSVGDIVVVGGKAMMVDRFGFAPLDDKPTEESRVMEGKFHAARRILSEAHEVKLAVKDDHEVSMAQAELYRLAKDAIALHNMLDEMRNLEGWVSAKITLATDYVGTVRDYIEHELVHPGEGEEGGVEPDMDQPSMEPSELDMPREARGDFDDEEDEVVSDPDQDKIQHIVMQLRKAYDVGGNYPITFRDGSKHKLDNETIAAFMNKYMSLKPMDRETMQDQASKSLLDFQATLESMDESVENKETPIDVLARIVRDKQADTVKFADGNSMKVDLFSASAILGVYHNLKKEETKAKLRSTLDKKGGFLKVLDFALSK